MHDIIAVLTQIIHQGGATMSRIYVDLRSRTPIFEQIIHSVRDLVIRGLLAPDEHLPSVRVLAAELAINPNTIQKAYGELERQGVIYSLAGRGNFVASDISALLAGHRAELLHTVENAVRAASEYGIAEDEILQTVKQALKTKGGNAHD